MKVAKENRQEKRELRVGTLQLHRNDEERPELAHPIPVSFSDPRTGK